MRLWPAALVALAGCVSEPAPPAVFGEVTSLATSAACVARYEPFDVAVTVRNPTDAFGRVSFSVYVPQYGNAAMEDVDLDAGESLALVVPATIDLEGRWTIQVLGAASRVSSVPMRVGDC